MEKPRKLKTEKGKKGTTSSITLLCYLKILSVLKLHFGVKWFYEKGRSCLPLYITLPSKFTNDVEVTRAQTGNM